MNRLAAVAAGYVVLVAGGVAILKPPPETTLPAFQSRAALAQWAAAWQQKGMMMEDEFFDPPPILDFQTTGSAGMESRGLEDVQPAARAVLHRKELAIYHQGLLTVIDTGSGTVKWQQRLQPDCKSRNADEWVNEDYAGLLSQGSHLLLVTRCEWHPQTHVDRIEDPGEGQLHMRQSFSLDVRDRLWERSRGRPRGESMPRLIGDRLVMVFQASAEATDAGWPHIKPADAPLLTADRVYLAGAPPSPFRPPALTLLVSCDTVAPQMSCRATALAGNRPEELLLGADSAYIKLWTDASRIETVYRLPLSGKPATALNVPAFKGWWEATAAPGGGLLLTEDFNEVRHRFRGNLWTLPPAAFGSRAATLASPAGLEQTAPMSLVSTRHQNHAVRVGGHLVIYTTDLQGGARVGIAPLEDPSRLEQAQLPVWPSELLAIDDHLLVIGDRPGVLSLSMLAPGGPGGFQTTEVPLDPMSHETAVSFRSIDYAPTGPGKGLLALTAQPVDGSTTKPYLLLFTREDDRLALLGRLGSSLDRHSAMQPDCTFDCSAPFSNAGLFVVDDRLYAVFGPEVVVARVDEGRLKEVVRLDLRPSEARDTRTSQTE